MNVIKQHSTALSVAEKKTAKSQDGTVWEAIEVPGGYQVVKQGAAPAPVEPEAPVPALVQDETQEVAPIVPASDPAPEPAVGLIVTQSNDVTVDVKGAYQTDVGVGYVFVPELGGKFRYFFKSKVKQIEPIDGGLRLTLPARDLKRRGLHTVLNDAKAA